MTPQPPRDPLIALWQTTPAPDTSHLLRDLERLKQLHQRLNRTIMAILLGFDLLLVFEEATGRLRSHGILSTLWTLGLALGLIYHRRTHCAPVNPLTLDMVSLLKNMIVRAKRDLLLARSLYLGAPIGAIIVYLVTRLAGISTSPLAIGAVPRLHAVQTAAGVAAILAMMVAGILLEHARRTQVQDLSRKLKLVVGEM
ncbi:hypothetical protein [uncultured Paludibaculum sp.]|uniref:hypothetical protein n=1 Tax=uncultured Paludibaculum sp. TaxID=1765020 RepID=UPI002AAAF140|nr:hypothetical protein [uncultured Paludibaculum sp.]